MKIIVSLLLSTFFITILSSITTITVFAVNEPIKGISLDNYKFMYSVKFVCIPFVGPDKEEAGDGRRAETTRRSRIRARRCSLPAHGRRCVPAQRRHPPRPPGGRDRRRLDRLRGRRLGAADGR